jgi:hypothetical protein
MKLNEFFQENNEKFSLTRLILFVWVFCILGVWAYVAIKTKTVPPLDSSMITMVAILLTGKIAQKYVEK